MHEALAVSVEEVRQKVQAKGGVLACPTCGGEGFAMEEVSVLASGRSEQYGTRRLPRAQLLCENCGCLVIFDLAKLGAGRQAGGA